MHALSSRAKDKFQLRKKKNTLRISVIIACHNRKSLTLNCINSAQAAAKYADAEIDFTVFDDGSIDGTPESLTVNFPDARILRGDGTSYWASSMAKAEKVVIQNERINKTDYILWLNDDVTLDETAFTVLLAAEKANLNSVIVGATRDGTTGLTTYSGMKRGGPHPLRFTAVASQDYIQNIDTFNGNIVLVPIQIAKKIGGIDGNYSHALADIDYGLRCRRSGISVIQAPKTLGICSRNQPTQLTTMTQDWKRFRGPKGGGNYDSLRRIIQKSNPNTWRLYIYSSYALWWLRRAGHSLVKKNRYE